MAISSLLPTTATSKHQPRHHQKHRHHPDEADDPHHHQKQRKKKKKQQLQPHTAPLTSKPPSSWEQFKNLLSCRSLAPSQVHDPSSLPGKYSKLGYSCSELCSFKDVAHNNTLVVRHRSDNDYTIDSTQLLPIPSTRATGTQQHHSSRGMQLRKLSGCYECRAISEPTRYPMPRTICRCPECGEVFTKTESLEVHQTLRHAVSELGPEDSGRNIVEIIFKSSWIKNDAQQGHPVFFKIDRILKVHNTQRTVSRFEDYRDAVKSRAALLLLHTNTTTAASLTSRANKKNPRCAADGNELLRFHCATLSCSLGSRGSTSLCCTSTAESCRVCGILRYGFGRAVQEPGKGVRTTASSGRAHECCGEDVGRRRAMLVCRVIAGRVRRQGVEEHAQHVVGDDDGGGGGYDSLAGGKSAAPGGGASEELFMANPRAILPCFLVVYRTVEIGGM